VKYSAGNVATVEATGRGIGSGFAVGTGVAPAFPPAARLSTASVTRTLLPRGSCRAADHFRFKPRESTRTALTDRWSPIPAALRLPDDGLLRNPSAGSLAGGKPENRHIHAGLKVKSESKPTGFLTSSGRRRQISTEKRHR